MNSHNSENKIQFSSFINFRTAKSYGAVIHCIQTVWEKKHIRKTMVQFGRFDWTW